MKKLLITILSVLTIYVVDAQTRVTAPIVRNSPIDTGYSTHIDTLGKGGLMVFTDTATRNALPFSGRKQGMVVVVQDSIMYQLVGGLSNDYWKRIFFSSNGTVISGDGIDSITLIMNVLCQWSGGLATCYELGTYYDSVSLNLDSTFYHFWNDGNFMDSIWIPQEGIFGSPSVTIRDTAITIGGVPTTGHIFESSGTAGGTVFDTAFRWSVRDSVSIPPSAPDTGSKYLVGTAPTGAFVTHANEIATWDGASWSFETATTGDLLFNAATDFVSKFNLGVWTRIGLASHHQGGDRYGAPLIFGSRDYNPLIGISNSVRSYAIGDSTTMNTSFGFGAYRSSVLQKLSANGVSEGNSAFGFKALASNTTGVYNTATGNQALFSNTSGGNNTANGYLALFSNTTGGTNSAYGRRALYTSTTASGNTANGDFSMWRTTTGSNNTGIGLEAGGGNTTGFDGVAIGYKAMGDGTNTADGNVGVGAYALRNNTSGQLQVAIGKESLGANTTGSFNTATGRHALRFNTTGGENVANGLSAGRDNLTGNANTIVGTSSGFYNIDGSNNVFLGYRAGAYVNLPIDNQAQRLNNSIMIGFQSQTGIDSGTNQINIGYDVQALASSNSTSIGNGSTVNSALYGSLAVRTGTMTIADASAQIDVSSTTKGGLLPRMTSVQRLAISSPATGLIVYDTDSLCYFSHSGGGTWVSMCGGTGGGGGTTYGATNGLTLTGTDFGLGGTLTGSTVVDLDGNYFTVEDGAATPLYLRSDLVTVGVNDGIGFGGVTFNANVSNGYSTIFGSSDGTNFVTLSMDAVTNTSTHTAGTHTFNGGIIYNTPVSGASTDSILTWDSNTGTINMRDASVYAGLYTGDGTLNGGAFSGFRLIEMNDKIVNFINTSTTSLFQIHYDGGFSSNTSSSIPFMGTNFSSGAERKAFIGDRDMQFDSTRFLLDDVAKNIKMYADTIDINTPLLRINGVPYSGGGGGGNGIYGGSGSLPGNVTVDLDGNYLSIQDGGNDALLLDRANDTYRLGDNTKMRLELTANDGRIAGDVNGTSLIVDDALQQIEINGAIINNADTSTTPFNVVTIDENNQLRRAAYPGGASTGTIYNEAITGTTNPVFTLTDDYITGTVRVYKNGVRITDFTETDTDEITVGVTPLVTDTYTIDFDYNL